MEQVTAVSKGTTFSFFLLLALAASASAVFLNTTKQENIVITVSSDRQACTSSNAGEMWTAEGGADPIWVCQNNKWIPYDLVPSIGKTESLAASSCKEVRDALPCKRSGASQQSGSYWITVTDPCTQHNKTMKVYCDMDLDGGGWTMVWKHSYMEVLPLTTAMYYFSQHYRECSDMEAGWCNIPNKGHLQPTHMMIAAYHNKTVVWAYKGWFNWNIDHDWTGGVLVEPVQVVDTCTFTSWSLGKPPAPSTHDGDRRLLGIAFDKHSPDNYFDNCVTISGQFTSPGDCRHVDCMGGWSPIARQQMTVVIYIR